MPAILTHYTFALEMLPSCSKGFDEAIFLGSQGPDPFFFYGQRPWKRRSKDYLSVNAFGSFLHHTDIAPFYATMMKIASESGADKDLLFAYIEGLWLHYSLDRECHAYIFPASGFSSDPVLSKRYSTLHTYFETMIDSLLSHKKGTYTSRPQKYLSLSKKQLDSISLLWFKTNQETLKDSSIQKDTFSKSVKDYRAILRMTNTPHLLSKAFITLIMGKNSLPAAMNIPWRIPKKLLSVDFLNECHCSWPDMISGASHTESFFDLMNRAKKDFLMVLPFIKKARNGEDTNLDLHSFVGVLCHDGCDPSLTKRFSKPRWPLNMIPKLK